MVNVASRLMSLLSILIFSAYQAHGKCGPYEVDQFYKDFPVFLKGYVRNLKELKSKNGKDIGFTIEIVKVYKGEIDKAKLKVVFPKRHSKPADKRFVENREYIFAVKNIKDENADIVVSGCSPKITEADITRLKERPEKGRANQ